MKMHKETNRTVDPIVEDKSGAKKNKIQPIMQQPDHITACGSAIRNTETWFKFCINVHNYHSFQDNSQYNEAISNNHSMSVTIIGVGEQK